MSDNCEPRKVLIDIGPSVSIMNGNIVRKERVTDGRMVQVRCYDGTTRSLHHSTTVIVEFQGLTLEVKVVIVHIVEFYLLLSRPDMKKLRLNISWKDEVTTYETYDHFCSSDPQCPQRIVKDAEQVPLQYPELICIETHPPATPYLSVPFTLRDTSVVRKKPHSMSHEKKAWLKRNSRECWTLVLLDHQRPLSHPQLQSYRRMAAHIVCAQITDW